MGSRERAKNGKRPNKSRSRDRARDSVQGKKHVRHDRKRNEEEGVDEFGRAIKIADDYRDGKAFRTNEGGDRNSSLCNITNDLRADVVETTSFSKQETDKYKFFEVPLSEDWEQIMEQKFE